MTDRSAVTSHASLTDLYAEMKKVGPLHEVVARLPRSGREYTIVRPDDIDALLDLAEGDPEETLPYWAALWPSGIGLADALLEEPDLVRNRIVLELGSGLGVTATAAMEIGCNLICTDYYDLSLLFSQYTVLRNTGRRIRTMRINWREPDQSFLGLAPEGFPVILAADVLYEQRDVEPLLDVVSKILAPNGLLWLAEPRRASAARFLELAAESGWDIKTDEHDGPWPELNDTGVIVRVHKLRRLLS